MTCCPSHRRAQPGRKSGESLLARVRISSELEAAVTRAGEAAGETRAEWVRLTLSRAVRRAG